MLHVLKPFHCPSCNASYCNKDYGRQHNQVKYPVILPCNHSVCECCLYQAVKNRTTFACSVCKVNVDLSSGNDAISKLFPDLHALGILNSNKKQSLPSIKIKMVSTPEMTKNLSSSGALKSTVKICDNCHQVEALWQCDECQSNFCNLCFDQVHKKMRSKKKHEVRKIFAELYNTMVQKGCLDHKNKSVEFYCEKDDKLTCSHCMLIGDHIGHEVKTLVDKNKSCAEELKTLLVDISSIEKRLKYTEHLLSEVSATEKIDVSSYVKEVHDYFHRLHSVLQTREVKLISQLEDIANLQNEPFEKMVFEISGYQKEIASIKKDAESVIENPCLAISAPYLLKKLESFKDIPCYLLPIQANMDNKVEINLKLDEDENELLKFGSIDYSIKPRFHLVPTQNLPENYCMDIPSSFVASDVESQSNATLDSYSEDSLMTPTTSKCGIEAAFKYRDFNRCSPEAVVVSYIKDPSCFWVQRYADLRKLTSISDAINKWCRSRDTQMDQHIPIEIGDLYLVQFSRDRKWYRGRIKRVLEPGDTYEITVPSKVIDKPKQTKIVHNDELKIEVFYIDFGNTEVVSISKLRNIQARFLTLPGLAKECHLVDIAPIDKGGWSHEAIESFRKFVNQKQVIMQIYEERNNVYSVDLSQVPDNGIANDVPVSVRDALVFLELAVFPSGARKVHSRRPTSERQFLPPERLKLSADIAVIVSHVDSPSHLYVQQISTASYLSSMIFEMNDAYCRDNNSLLHSIYAPHVGMVCAAQFSVDKQWYRARVIGLPGGSNVEVQYVDFGNKEIIHHKYIRKLYDRFSKLNIQAIPCKLADITYNQDMCWSNAAIEWLTNKVSKKQLILRSMGFDLGEKKSEILLFFTENDFEVCVNSLIVEAGFAASCGPGSTTAKKRLKKLEPCHPILEHSLEPAFPCELADEPIPEPISPPPIAAPLEKPSLPILAKNFPIKEGHHIEVHVSYIINPSVFYIRIAGDMEKKLEKLISEIQKVYENFESTVEDCSIGKSYAVYSDIRKQWYRGTVLSKIDDKVKVLFVDYGSEEDVPIKNVQKLLEKFTDDEEYSIRCELTGIIPAGGSPNWSHAACDAFQDLVAGHETLHLSCKGGIEKDLKSLPVSLFIEEVKIGGALEPTEIIYIDIASELVTRGLALPVRNNPKSACKSLNECEPEAAAACDKTREIISEDIKTDDNETKESIVDLLAIEVKVETEFKSPIKEEKSQIEVQYEPLTFQWKPAKYPTESKFKGFVTNIAEDGCIQLHIVGEGGGMVEVIKKALQFKYTKPGIKTLKKAPAIGQACVAKFELDNLWYRAEVLAVYPEKVKVNFIDYGNNEIVSWNEVCTDVILHNIPKQCMDCKIAKIHTGKPGQWDDDLLNFLHSQLVESIVEVECMGPPDENGKLPCEIMMIKCGISISELLQSMGFMESSSEQQMQRNKTFQPATELRENDIFPVCITQINSPNIVYLQRLKIPEPKSDYEKEYNKEHEAFLELIKELQERAETFPRVEEPVPGLACCAKYSYDDNWYRCEITDLVEDGVVVLYVDYGNSETIPAENLREPDSHIIDFPVQILFCEIYGMSPIGSDWDSQVRKFMIEKLLQSGLEIFAKVVIPGKISQIELMTKNEDGEMTLAYEELVDRNLITLQRNE